jgi:hypothetical protein
VLAVTLKDRVNAFVPCGIFNVLQTGARTQQLFNDLRMIASRFVDSTLGACRWANETNLD